MNNTQQTLQVEVVTGGAGYANGDVLTLSDGSTVTIATADITAGVIDIATTFTVGGSPTQTVLGQILTSAGSGSESEDATFRVTQLSATSSQDDDCVHVIVIDGAGTISGTIGEVLRFWEKLTKRHVKSV